MGAIAALAPHWKFGLGSRASATAAGGDAGGVEAKVDGVPQFVMTRRPTGAAQLTKTSLWQGLVDSVSQRSRHRNANFADPSWLGRIIHAFVPGLKGNFGY